MPKCVYCKKVYHVPKGLTLIMKDGTINYLCSAKCKKNMAMKRRKVRWISKTKKEKIAKVKEIKEVVKEKLKETPKVEEKKEEVKKEKLIA